MAIDTLTFFQLMIHRLLEHKTELKRLSPGSIKKVTIIADNHGCLRDVILSVDLPVIETVPISFGKTELIFEHGKVVAKKAEIRVRL